MVFYQETKSIGTGACYGVCGATLINNNHVIIAASCIGTTDTSRITLVAGMHNTQATTERNSRQCASVQTIYIHPQYDKTAGSAYDIAVLRLSTPFTYTTYVQPVCLSDVEPQPGNEAIIVGWGAITVGGSTRNVLKQAYTNIIGSCSSYWPQIDNTRQMCVSNTINGGVAYQGDGGGPVLTQNNGQYVVSGILSFTQTCNRNGPSNAPYVYTRTAFYKQWIQSIIG